MIVYGQFSFEMGQVLTKQLKLGLKYYKLKTLHLQTACSAHDTTPIQENNTLIIYYKLGKLSIKNT